MEIVQLALTSLLLGTTAARTFYGYDVNAANAKAIAVEASSIYVWGTANTNCNRSVTTADECTVALALVLEPLVVESINSQHFPAGCFVVSDGESGIGAFFNANAIAANSQDIDFEPLCRIGAPMSQFESASWCGETMLSSSVAVSEAECAQLCSETRACKGIAFQQSTRKCSLLSATAFILVEDSFGETRCATAASCTRNDEATLSAEVDLENCLLNPRLNQNLASLEACFEVGCASQGFDPNSSIVSCIGMWSNWTDCSQTCGLGQQSQTFEIETVAQNGGANCAVQQGSELTRGCELRECPTHCTGAWSSWGPCSVTCGSGQRRRNFTVVTPNAHGGEDCDFADGFIQHDTCEETECATTMMTATTSRSESIAAQNQTVGGRSGTTAPAVRTTSVAAERT